MQTQFNLLEYRKQHNMKKLDIAYINSQLTSQMNEKERKMVLATCRDEEEAIKAVNQYRYKKVW